MLHMLIYPMPSEVKWSSFLEVGFEGVVSYPV